MGVQCIHFYVNRSTFSRFCVSRWLSSFCLMLLPCRVSPAHCRRGIDCFGFLFVVVAMCHAGCLLPIAGGDRGKKRGKKTNGKITFPIREADADVKEC
jgi:hypothetical protein